MSETITVKILSGPEIEAYIPDLARLRIEVFRDFPYLYDGTTEYEERYLHTYVESPESVVVLALDGERAVGASTGLPMEDETPEFKRPFLEHGYDPARKAGRATPAAWAGSTIAASAACSGRRITPCGPPTTCRSTPSGRGSATSNTPNWSPPMPGRTSIRPGRRKSPWCSGSSR
jgi:hypothetical protein